MSRAVEEAIARTQRALDRIAEQDRLREAAEAERLAGLRAQAAAARPQSRYRPTGADIARVCMALDMIARAEARWLEQIQKNSGGGA